MKNSHIALILVALSLSLPATPVVFAQKTVTGKHGSTASSSVTRKGNTVTGTGSVTGARGNSATGKATVTKTATGTSGTATINGPKGGTSTASGTATPNGNGTTTVAGTATGPRGTARSGSRTVKQPAQQAPQQ
jgi:hypothetical protein